MRVIEKKRPPFMTRKKWFTIIMLLIILIVTIVVLQYQSIYRSLWQQENEIESLIKASEQYQLNEDYELSKYVWDQSYWILTALNHNNQNTISVWNEAERLIEVLQSEMVDEHKIRSIVESRYHNLNSIRIQMAYLYGQLAWEIQFEDPDTKHLKIAFYQMSDGKYIDEYTIPKETRP